MNKENPVFEHEHEIRTSSLESRWFQWTVRGVFSENDELVEVQWVGRDVTDRIRLLERLNKIDKIDSLGVFAGGIAHDFNNYLTSIMGTLTLMRRTIDKSDPRSHRLEEAEHSVMKATELNKLSHFFQGWRTDKKNDFRVKPPSGDGPVRPAGVGYHAISGLRRKPVVCGGRRGADVPGPEQSDLIDAKQAMPKGGNIQIEAMDVEMEEGSDVPLPAGQYVKITIKDNGTGIPQNIVAKIFDPFFTTKRDGNGLGLTIVHSIVSKHGGFIDVASNLGIGVHLHNLSPGLHLEDGEGTSQKGVQRNRLRKVTCSWMMTNLYWKWAASC